MSIPSAKYLKAKAANRLDGGKEPRRVALCYASIVAVSSLVVNGVKYLLQNQIAQTGGIQNIGTRSMLSTLDTVLPLVQTLVLMCLTLGYMAAMLRISRRQFASEKTLKAGFERFWVLLRTRLLQVLIYGAIAFGLSYLALTIFVLSPLSNGLTAVLLPLANAGTFTPETLLGDDALLFAVYDAMIPMMLIYVLLLVPAVWAVSYHYRLVDYLLIEQPQLGAFGALRESKQKMKGHKKELFKVDLSYWWYYLLLGLSTSLVYLDLVLGAVGISIPLSPMAQFFAVVILCLGTDFALTYFLRNRVEVTYALFYDSLCPRQPAPEGAVLGNIFQM